MYFRKFHLTPMEHQGPVSYPCIWSIWTVVKCHNSASSKTAELADRHRYTGSSKGQISPPQSGCDSWAPHSAEEDRTQCQRENSQEGQSMVVTEPCSTHCLLEQMGARDWRCAMTTARTFFQFPPLSLLFSPPPFLSFFVRLRTYFYGPSTRTESKPKGVDTPFRQRSKSFLFENLKKYQILFLWWWLPGEAIYHKTWFPGLNLSSCIFRRSQWYFLRETINYLVKQVLTLGLPSAEFIPICNSLVSSMFLPSTFLLFFRRTLPHVHHVLLCR